MASRHRFKCLNDSCPSIAGKKPLTFVAEYLRPSCPHCGCIKLEDWGVDQGFMVGGAARGIDSTLRNLAERNGMTNMSNRGGQAVKQAAQAPSGNHEYVNVGGYAIPKTNDIVCTSTGSPYKVGAATDSRIASGGAPTPLLHAEHKAAV